MLMRKFKFITQSLLVLGLVVFLPALATAAQGTHRSTTELEKDLRDTKREFKKFQSLQSKLNSAAKQSSNASRDKAMGNLHDFMGECIVRREKDLGQEITIKQHGEMVKSGTSEVAEAGSPVPGNKRSKGSGLNETTNSDRLRQLSNMKSLYVSAKNNARPAMERQGQSLDRYQETIGKFGQQLDWAISGLTRELDRRQAEKPVAPADSLGTGAGQ